MDEQRASIGYWVKQVDELLTERIDEAQRSHDLTRLDWQVLNVILETDVASDDKIAATLRPFADASTIESTLDRLVARDLVSESGNDYKVTDTGTDVYEQALSSQKEVRQRAAAGISETEYATAMSVLQRLVENLE